METFALPPIVSNLGPTAVLMSLVAGVIWAIVTGKLVPKSQLDYRETLVDKASSAADNWKSAHASEVRRNNVLMRIVSDIVGGETAATRLVATLREKVEDAPQKEGTS